MRNASLRARRDPLCLLDVPFPTVRQANSVSGLRVCLLVDSRLQMPDAQTHLHAFDDRGHLPRRLPFSCATFFTCSWNARSSSSDLFGRLCKHDITACVFLKDPIGYNKKKICNGRFICPVCGGRQIQSRFPPRHTHPHRAGLHASIALMCADRTVREQSGQGWYMCGEVIF